MEQFLWQFPYLKHLEIKAHGWKNLFDGYQWQKLTNFFTTFNFKFDTEDILMDNILDSFSTPYWLEEKHWFIGYKNGCLFSIPHFAPDHIDISWQTSLRSTALNHTVIYDRLNKITIKTDVIDSNYYFTHIKELILECSISVQILTSTMDLNQIKHLSVLSIDDILKLIPLESNMPQLCELSIKNDVTSDMIERIRLYRFSQIHKLEIGIFTKYSDYITEELFRLFAFVQHLIYKSPIESIQTMICFIDGFKHLSNASFFCDDVFFDTEASFCQDPNSIIEYSKRLTKDNFTCRIYRSTKYGLSSYGIYWWIEDQPSSSIVNMYWLPQQRYHWYRFKYFFLFMFHKSFCFN
ncbi:unnamed protein product [Rotaria sp. Silwood1]|nr:unnamed protein product [Rotaria sp. Silwood1]CAF1312248.1 unnamed protein product [Rotaria sp. Silwood1]CAF3524355.1 unnamed protein product [Rotaria sp. Silwood1]CAF4604293.1 unnamed protein product [Rotaria sp. Silwood1]